MSNGGLTDLLCVHPPIFKDCSFAGYIGSVELLQTIKRVVGALREQNPDLIYVCDPVLGDDGRLYLPGEMVGLYRSDILPLATIITPNQFEAEQLTGASVATEQEALQACRALMERGPKTVVSIPPQQAVSSAFNGCSRVA